MNKVLIFGVSGQDGTILSKLLLEKKMNILGVTRNLNQQFKNHIFLNTIHNIKIITLKNFNYINIFNLINSYRPNYIYNFSGESSVSLSYINYFETYSSIIEITENILRSIHQVDKRIKYFNTSSSECYGNFGQIINENSPHFPMSPYAIAKSTAFEISKYYRNEKNIFSCSGIMFNHESPLRKKNFVIKKIFDGIKKIKKNPKFKIKLGNINIKRDWGWAPDFMYAAYLILNNKYPEDYVICSKNYHSLKYVIENAFKYNSLNFQEHIIFEKKLLRNDDILSSKGDNSKIKKELNWKPKNNLKKIIYKMSNNICDR